MTEDEAKAIVKECGWSYLRRRRHHQWYVYAARHVGGVRYEKYLGRVAELGSLTAEELKKKLGCA